jgi:hypothetical protein
MFFMLFPPFDCWGAVGQSSDRTRCPQFFATLSAGSRHLGADTHAVRGPIGNRVELLWTSLSDRLLLGLGRPVPLICPSTDLVLSVGITFLDSSLEFVVIPFDHHQVVARKRTPLSLELTFELAPLRFEMIGVHIVPPIG